MGKLAVSKVTEDFDIPEEAYADSRAGEYNFFALDKVKKSIFYAGKKESNANNAAKRFKANNPRCARWRFFAKEVEFEGEQGVRIWRIEDAPDGEPEPAATARISGGAAATFKKHTQGEGN